MQHVGISHTLSQLRRKYWIPRGRQAVKKAIAQCRTCRRYQGPAFRMPRSPDMPPERVTRSPPFTYTAVDYFGPLCCTDRPGEGKVWVALYTCLAIRSVHGDPAADQIVRGPSGGCRGDLISTPDFGYSRVFYKSFLLRNLSFDGCFEKSSLQALFWCKKLRSGQKIGKVTKRRRSMNPTCANGGTNRANGGTNASFCTSGDFPFFLACGQICFEFESATVKREKKERTKEKKDCGQLQRQREKISSIFRTASSLEKEIDDCLHLVGRISHAVDVAVHV